MIAEQLKLIKYIMDMQSLVHSLNVNDLKLKVVKIYQGRFTPFKDGIPNKS